MQNVDEIENHTWHTWWMQLGKWLNSCDVLENMKIFITTGGKSILEHGRGEIDHGADFWSYWMVLLLDFAIAYIALCIYENLPNSILKRNMFIGCDLYLNKVYI